MRTNINNHLRRSAAGIAASLLLFGLSASAQPFSSPVGEWDVVIGGARQGVAKLTFNSDGTLDVSEVLVPKVPGVNSGNGGDDSRGGGGDAGRGGPTGGGVVVLPDHTNLHGFFVTGQQDEVLFSGNMIIHGGVPTARWGFDTSGRIIGFFSEISAPITITTNTTDAITNVEFLRITNAISFTGKASSSGSRLTLLASTPAGKSTYSGLPPIVLPDLSGSWYGTKVQEGLPYNDFFTMGSVDGFNTRYGIDGEGPSYVFSGVAIVVRQKKMGIALSIVRPHNPPPGTGDDLIVRAVLGSVNLPRATFSGRGLEDTATGIDAITFKAARPLTLPSD